MPKVGEGIRTALDELKEYVHGLVPQKGMFSTLDELVQQAPFEKAPVEQWQNFLKPGRMLKRGEMQFPLKQEELDYVLPKALEGSAPNTVVTKEQMLEQIRQNRPQFSLSLNSNNQRPGMRDHQSASGNPNPRWKQEVNEVMPTAQPFEGDVGRAKSTSFGGLEYGPDVQSDYDRLWHLSDHEAYQESITRMPEDVDYSPQHFGRDAISSSRVSIHELPNSLDNVRLVDEIQSDLHQDAGEKFRPDNWRDMLDAEDLRAVREIEAEKEQLGNVRAANFGMAGRGITPEIADHNDAPLLEKMVALDLKLANYSNKADQMRTRRGYRTPETPYVRGEKVVTGDGSHGVFLRLTDDGKVVVRDGLSEYEHDPGDVTPFTRHNAIPDAPFKESSAYGRLELKKQLLQAAHAGESHLALTRGADQVERYSLQGKKAENMSNIYDKVYLGEMKKLAQHYGAEVVNIKMPVGQGKDVRPEFMARNGIESVDEAKQYLDGDMMYGGLDEIDGGNIETTIDDMRSAYRLMRPIFTSTNPGADIVKRMEELYKKVSGHDPHGLDVKWTDETKEEYKDITNEFTKDIGDWLQHASFNGLDKKNKTFPAIKITPEVREKIKKHGTSLWARGGKVKKRKKMAQGGPADSDYETALMSDRMEQATHHPGPEPFDPTEKLLGRRNALAKRFAESFAEQWAGLDEQGQLKGGLYHDWNAPREQWVWNDEAGMELPPLKAAEPVLTKSFRTLPEQFFGDQQNPSQALQDLHEIHRQMMDRADLDEPEGLAENVVTAGGAVAAQMPVPGGMFGKLASRLPRAARLALWPEAKYLDYLGPTVHPSLGGYAMPALVGGVLNTAGDAYKNRAPNEAPPTLDDDQLMQLELQIARMDKAHAEGHAKGGKVSEGIAEGVSSLRKMIERAYSEAKVEGTGKEVVPAPSAPMPQTLDLPTLKRMIEGGAGAGEGPVMSRRDFLGHAAQAAQLAIGAPRGTMGAVAKTAETVMPAAKPPVMSDFPNVAKALYHIDLGSNGFDAKPIDPGIRVPTSYVQKFAVAEKALSSLAGKKIRDVVPEKVINKSLKEDDGTFELVDDDEFNDALGSVAVPANDAGDIIMKHAGIKKKDANTVNSIFEAYFDGMLTDLLHNPGSTEFSDFAAWKKAAKASGYKTGKPKNHTWHFAKDEEGLTGYGSFDTIEKRGWLIPREK